MSGDSNKPEHSDDALPLQETMPPGASGGDGDDLGLLETMPPGAGPSDGDELRLQETIPPGAGPSDGDDLGLLETMPPGAGGGDGVDLGLLETMPPGASGGDGVDLGLLETMPPGAGGGDDVDLGLLETMPPGASHGDGDELRLQETVPPGGGDGDELRLQETVPPGAASASAPAPAPRPAPAATPAPTAAQRTQRPTEEQSAAIQIRPGAQFGKYELIRELGRGGMGAVYLARDIRLGRRVAIKFLNVADADLRRHFLAEAQTTAQCQHENIVVLFEADEYSGVPFMVLEYIEGQTLAHIVDERREARKNGQIAPDEILLPVERVTELLMPVLRALERAHDMGIVHCDLKPANIMLTSTGVIKVLDFGIAKVLPRRHSAGGEDADSLVPSSETQGGVGTLPYMSPEQFSGQNIDHRTDVWAMGIILYEMLTGEHPLWPLSIPRLDQIRRVNVPMPSIKELRPELGPMAQLIDKCLIKPQDERMTSAAGLAAELEPFLPGRGQARARPDSNPFAGLSAFQEADADRFYGRSADIANLVTLVRHQPLVSVIGPSGVGKSSLIRAGVVPALKRSGEGWESMVLRPGPDPLAALLGLLEQMQLHTGTRQALNELLKFTGDARDREEGSDPDSTPADRAALIDRLKREPGYLGTSLRVWAQRRMRRVIILIDQFEELFTLSPDPDSRSLFLACLTSIADDASSPLRVVVTMRADFLERLAVERDFMSQSTRGLAFLAPMGRAGLRDALNRPIEDVGYGFENQAMVERMLDELASTQGALPLLQFTASRLWEARDADRKLLTEASYEAMGGVAGTLAQHADQVLSGMTGRQAKLTRAVFQRLVSPERTRAIVSLRELRSLSPEPDEIDEVVGILADSRLVVIETRTDGRKGDISISATSMDSAVADSGSMNGVSQGTVELVHESLIVAWPTLARWLDQNREDAQFLARLRSAARQWHQGRRAEGLLWRDQAAEDAQRWQKRHEELAETREHDVVLSDRERAFLAEVVRRHERERKRRQRIFGAIAAVCAVVAVVVSVLALQARNAERQAERAQKQAERDAIRARNALRVATAREYQDDPTMALALVREVEGGDIAPPAAWANIAQQALQDGVASAILDHPEPVSSARFSPDGKYLATGAGDGKVRIFARADSSELREIDTGHKSVHALSYSPDGKRLAVAAGDKHALVYDLERPGKPIRLGPHSERVSSIEFSNDGKLVATASEDINAMIHGSDGKGDPITLDFHAEAVRAASFSADDQRVITAATDGLVHIHLLASHRNDISDDEDPVEFEPHGGAIFSARFSRDGKLALTSSTDNTARLWNLHTMTEERIFGGHEKPVLSASFSPDETSVLTTSADHTAQIHDVAGLRATRVLRGHADMVNAGAFSPDGTEVVTASDDGTVRVWSLATTGAPERLVGPDKDLRYAAFAPDGQGIATASVDGKARIFKSRTDRKPLELASDGGIVFMVQFSPDGRRAVVASNVSARVYDLTDPARIVAMEGHTDSVVAAVFSPDGKHIATASGDGSARIWNAATGKQIRTLPGHGDQVHAIVYSADGKRIATGSRDSIVRVFVAADGDKSEPRRLEGHSGLVDAVAFSPDGKRILSSGSDDQTVRLWRADGPGGASGTSLIASWPDVRFRGQYPFSPDGALVVTYALTEESGSRRRSLRVFSTDGVADGLARPPVDLRGIQGIVWTASFSPSGAGPGGLRIMAATENDGLWIFSEFRPIERLDDSRLWRASKYCMPKTERIARLNISADMAREDYERCEQRVATEPAP